MGYHENKEEVVVKGMYILCIRAYWYWFNTPSLCKKTEILWGVVMVF